MKPTIGEMAEAKKFPNGWVYRIHHSYDPNGRVPSEAIIGAWQVNEAGEIIGEFRENPNYNPEKL